MLAPLLFSVLIVFSKLKQIPWLRGILIILLFETYGVVTLVLVGSVHNKCKFCSSVSIITTYCCCSCGWTDGGWQLDVS